MQWLQLIPRHAKYQLYLSDKKIFLFLTSLYLWLYLLSKNIVLLFF
jgi:hypothetical protein